MNTEALYIIFDKKDLARDQKKKKKCIYIERIYANRKREEKS